MEIEVIKNKYVYRYEVCPHCKSEMKIKKNTIQYHYSKGYRIADIVCPCCNEIFVIHQ